MEELWSDAQVRAPKTEPRDSDLAGLRLCCESAQEAEVGSRPDVHHLVKG